MGYPDSFPTKSEAKTAVVSGGVDSRRYVNRSARLVRNVSEFGQALRVSEPRTAVQYCISNDLI